MKRFARVTIARAAHVLGLWRTRRLVQAEKVRKLFESLQINTVIDVGANRGHYRDFLRIEVGFVGRIHSVEPISALVEEMAMRRSRDSEWTIHRLAFGNEVGEQNLNVMAMQEFSSFLTPHTSLPNQFKDENRVVQSELVSVCRLDDFIAEFAEPLDLGRTFLKLDTQGFDLEVVKGGISSLSKIPALQTELSMRPVYHGAPTWTTTLKHLSDIGFEISDMFVVTEDEMLRAVEFDCLMVRSGAGSPCVSHASTQ